MVTVPSLSVAVEATSTLARSEKITTSKSAIIGTVLDVGAGVSEEPPPQPINDKASNDKENLPNVGKFMNISLWINIEAKG